MLFVYFMVLIVEFGMIFKLDITWNKFLAANLSSYLLGVPYVLALLVSGMPTEEAIGTLALIIDIAAPILIPCFIFSLLLLTIGLIIKEKHNIETNGKTVLKYFLMILFGTFILSLIGELQ